MDQLRAAVARRRQTSAEDQAALDALHRAVAEAVAARHPVADVVTETAYSRETVRRIARERGVMVDGRSSRRQGNR